MNYTVNCDELWNWSPESGCNYSISFSGDGTETTHKNDGRTWHYWASGTAGCDVCNGYQYSFGETISSSTSIFQDCTGCNCDWKSFTETSDTGSSSAVGCYYSSGSWDSPSTSGPGGVLYYPASNIIDPTHCQDDMSYPVEFGVCGLSEPVQYTFNDTRAQELSSEYTDDELRANILSLMGPYVTCCNTEWYSALYNDDDLFCRCAYSRINKEHTGNPAELQKMKYRLLLPTTEVTLTYTVTWDVITRDLNTGEITVEPRSATVSGTGSSDPVIIGSYEVMPPHWDTSNDDDGYVITWVDDVSVSSEPATTWSLPGSGPYPGSNPSARSGCTSCGAQVPWSEGNDSGLHARFGLGKGPERRCTKEGMGRKI
jgi:hypothetical protein